MSKRQATGIPVACLCVHLKRPLLVVAGISSRHFVRIALPGSVRRVARRELPWREVRARRSNAFFQFFDLELYDLFLVHIFSFSFLCFSSALEARALPDSHSQQPA